MERKSSEIQIDMFHKFSFIRMKVNGLGDQNSIPGQVIPKIKKKKEKYLMFLCLTLRNIRYESRVSREIQGKQ